MDQNLTSLIWTIVAIAAIFYVMNMFSGKEGYQNEQESGIIKQIQQIKEQQEPLVQNQQKIQQLQQQSLPALQQNELIVQQQQQAAPVEQQQQPAPVEQQQPVSMSDNLTSSDLLPNENGFSSWGDAAPENNALEGRNFLESGHHFGINTVGQSLRNANLQLRSDPTIPQVDVGPWLQSTIEQDTNKRQFEVGGDY